MAAIPSLYTRLKSRYVFICESVSKQVIKGMFVLTDAAALATRLRGLIAILAGSAALATRRGRLRGLIAILAGSAALATRLPGLIAILA